MEPPSPKILVVEDDPQLQQMYRRKLNFEKFTALVAGTGEEGLRMAKEQHPDLILLDVMLPGNMNGFDVLEVLKRDENLKAIPVIMSTNLNSEETVAKTIGVVDYLVKANTSLEEVIEKIKKHLPTP